MTAPVSAPPTLLGKPGERCASCGAPLAEDQRYCLNCGRRRAEARVAYDVLLRSTGAPTSEAPGQSTALLVPEPAGPLGPRTISPLGAAAGLGLLLFAVLVGATVGDRGDAAPAAQQAVVAVPAAATTPATTPAAFVSDWTGADGWTVQLQTLPKTGTMPEQIAAAKQAVITAGATDVGALDTATFPSLPADSYLIYSGRFDDKKAAKAALKDLKASFPDAAVVEVSTAAAGADAPEASSPPVEVDPAETKALQDLENASPEDYVKKSKKLPDDIGTTGTPPPVDNVAPGGGSDDGTTIE